MMSEVDYQGSSYIPPRVAVAVGALLRGPREVGHSVHFSDLFSSFEEEQRAYVDGLSAVPIIFFSFFLSWLFILILLKVKGTEVGCASGRAFVSIRTYDENEEVEQEKPEDDLASTSESSNADTMSESSVKPLFLGSRGEMMEHSNSDIKDDNNNFGKKIWQCIRRKNKEDTGINPIERRTRFSFLIFASIALFCAPVNLFLTFGPLMDAAMEVSTTESPDSFLLKAQNIIDEVEISLASIESLSAVAIELVTTVPIDPEIICPLVNSTDFEKDIGVDINDIIGTIIYQQHKLEEDITARLSTVQSFSDGIEDGLSTIEAYADESLKYIWILPGLLLTIGALAMTSITGVLLAWKEKCGTRFQRVLSYVVLPLLIIVAIICWIVVMVFSLGTMVGTDICFSGSSNGSPDQTIQEILTVVGNDAEGTAYEFASIYVNQCNVTDPTQEIHVIKLEVQDNIDNIWRQISKIDSVGRADVIERCGDTGKFVEMLSGARDLAMTLTDIRRSLSSLEDSIGCSSMYSMYTQVAHDVICTESLSASGYGFITFLIMWICVMAMINLRASWLNSTNVEEGRNYHDEAEVAENMVVDEHEEYLAYISRYKHEWQEYEGIEEDRVVKPSPRSEFHETQQRSENSEAEDSDRRSDPNRFIYYGDDEADSASMDSRSIYTEGKQQQQEEPSIIYQRQLTAHEIMDHNDDGVSYASGEISFASFSSELKNDVGNLGSILTLPPPALNPEFSEEKQRRTVIDPDGAYDGGKAEEIEVRIDEELFHL